MEGTRKGVFKEIDGWINDFGAPNVLWVSGCPGSGKSAIGKPPLPYHPQPNSLPLP